MYNVTIKKGKGGHNNLKQKDLVKILKSNGYYFLRSGGNHDIYTNGEIMIPVPRHKEINEITAKEILKEAGL